MTIGYARTSTADQSANLQLDALNAAHCERIFTDVASGAKASRPELDAMLAQLRSGDIVVVWKLDRLGRSLRNLIDMVEGFKDKGVGFRSITESIDTTTPGGQLFFHIFGAFAEYERNLIRERTKEGLAAARSRGRIGGRPKGLTKKAEQTSRIAESLWKEGKLLPMEICEQLTISKSTLYRYLAARGITMTK